MTARGFADVTGNASPVGDDNGDITTGLNDRRDVVVLREFVPDIVTNNQLSPTGTTGAMVDYVWGGGEETRVDSASGDTYTDLYVEFASGARIVYSFLSETAAGDPGINPVYSDWQALHAALFEGEKTPIGDIASNIDNSGGVTTWGGELSGDNGTIRWEQHQLLDEDSIYWRGSYDGVTLDDGSKPAPWYLSVATEAGGSSYLVFNHGIHTLDTLPGADLAFFERYTGETLAVFEQRPSDQLLGVETAEQAIEQMDQTYRSIAIRVAMQAGPLSHHFDGLA